MSLEINPYSSDITFFDTKQSVIDRKSYTMREKRNEIEIQGSIEEVWEILNDLSL